MCKTDRKARWFYQEKYPLRKGTFLKGSKQKTLVIKNTEPIDYGSYCCFGYDSTLRSCFWGCSELVMIGKFYYILLILERIIFGT